MLHSRKAFTLIELLIVVGIITILLGIILPVLSKVREHARVAQCVSNQHQIFLAIQDFRTANNEACPGVCGTIPAVGPGSTPYYGIGQLISNSDALPQTTLEQTSRSVLLIRGYLKDSSIFHCPQQDLMGGVQFGTTGSPATFHYVFTDFFVGDLPCVPGGAVTAATNFAPVYSPRFPNFQPPNSPITFGRSQCPGRCVLITEDGMLQDWAQSFMEFTIPSYVHATPWHVLRPHKAADRLPFIVADAVVCTYLDGHTELVWVVIKDGIQNYTVPSDHTGLPH